MADNTFNPQEWLTKPEPSPIQHKAPVQGGAQSGSLADDIETVIQRIESARIDITSGYDNWRDLGFALVDALGENGRDPFHRISRFNPDYDEHECDKQYDKCLRAHGTGVSYRTFFQKAKDYGISVSTSTYAKSAISAISAKSAYGRRNDESMSKSALDENAEIADSAEMADLEEDEPLPTFSQQVRGQLPELLAKIDEIRKSDADADILILGALTVISAAMPHIYGVYDQRIVYPNLFLFVTAPASSGKGRLSLCRYLVEPIHDNLRELNKEEESEYKRKLAEYNAAGKKKVNMDKPEEPPLRMLFIPANSSATAVYQVLHDNDERGLMFETEGDTLANTFGSDYGNYSDGFRKAFHHETISYVRRKDREYANIKSPKLSTLLTGTPRQILNLISDAENGLFSRFAFYYLNPQMTWNNVFSDNSGTTLEEYFQDLGKDYTEFYTILRDNKDLKFSFTIEQKDDFNATFEGLQNKYVPLCGDEFVASVRRLGVIMFRIAMCISVLRIMEDGNFSDDIICLDQNYLVAKTIITVLIQHNAKVFNELPKSTPIFNPAKNGEKTKLHQAFFDALPPEFDRKTYSAIAEQMGLNPKSIDRTVRKWCDDGKLENVAHGQYRKK